MAGEEQERAEEEMSLEDLRKEQQAFMRRQEEVEAQRQLENENLKKAVRESLKKQKDAEEQMEAILGDAANVKAAQITTKESLRESEIDKHIKKFKNPASKRMIKFCMEVEHEMEDLVEAWHPFLPSVKELQLLDEFDEKEVNEEDKEEISKSLQITATILAGLFTKVKEEKAMQEVASSTKAGWGAVNILEGKDAKYSGSVEEQEEISARAKKAEEEYFKINPHKKKQLLEKKKSSSDRRQGRLGGSDFKKFGRREGKDFKGDSFYTSFKSNRGRGAGSYRGRGRGRGAAFTGGSKTCFRCHSTGEKI